MYLKFKHIIKQAWLFIIRPIIPAIYTENDYLSKIASFIDPKSKLNGSNIRLYPPYNVWYSTINNYTYIANNSSINNTTIGKFCSIGPNFMCGKGIHPTNGLSTSPSFYSSSNKSNGISFCKESKCIEQKKITIGNDVFIGANVFIFDGVNIGDGAIIGAGAIVTKDIPNYAIAVGVPAKIIKYRFSQDQIEKLDRIKWWNWDTDKLRTIEKHFFDIDTFIKINEL